MIKYGYFSAPVNSNTRKRWITIALDRPEKESPSQVHRASFAFCSTKDNFVKEIGRRMASGRLIKNKNIVSYEYSGDIHKAISTALEMAIQNNLVPNWVVKAHKSKTLVQGLRKFVEKESTV
jgi:hypothetical protein